MAPILDHVVILVSSVSAAVEEFASKGFSVVRGGTHADGLTENALLILSDGTYIECIAFLPASAGEDDARRRKRTEHWWWGRQLGFIDWCLGPGVMESRRVVQAINERGEIRYDAPLAGGRRTAQGTNLNWVVSFPNFASCGPRGRLPFFCEDVPKDSRYLRVPPRVANASLSFSRLVVLVSLDNMPLYREHVETVMRGCSAESMPTGDADLLRFQVQAPGGLATIQIIIRTPFNSAERQHVAQRGDGVYEVVFKSSSRPVVYNIQSGRFALEAED